MTGGGDNAVVPPPCKSSIEPNVKAGLQFPIGKIATLLKGEHSDSGERVRVDAAVYLAAVVEYLTAELAELSGIAAMKEDLEIIRPRHVYSAVRNDEELAESLRRLDIEMSNTEEEGNGDDDEEYDYDSSDGEDDDEDEIPSDIDEEYVREDDEEDEDTDEGDVTNASVDGQECESVVVGQMSIAPGSVELYRKLISQFGEIVSSNLPNYKVLPTCVALTGLLNLVETMVEIVPENISQELVSDWEGMVSFYGGVGLKLGWLEDRVHRYGDWLARCSCLDVNELRGRVVAKQEELEKKHKEVSTLERELQELSAELETAQFSQSHFGFSFFDD